eukprot:8761675-Pyramimonas_sp.AAC.1
MAWTAYLPPMSVNRDTCHLPPVTAVRATSPRSAPCMPGGRQRGPVFWRACHHQDRDGCAC